MVTSLLFKNVASDTLSENGGSAASGNNGCLGFDDLLEQSSPVPTDDLSSLAAMQSPPPMQPPPWRPNSPWGEGGHESEFALCRSRSPSIGQTAMLDVFDEPEIQMLPSELPQVVRLSSAEGSGSYPLDSARITSDPKPFVLQSGSHLSREQSKKRPREESPFDSVFERPSMVMHEELDFERDVEDIVRLASNEGFNELSTTSQFTSKSTKPPLNSMPYTFNARPKEAQPVASTPASAPAIRPPKPNPYQLAYVLPAEKRPVGTWETQTPMSAPPRQQYRMPAPRGRAAAYSLNTPHNSGMMMNNHAMNRGKGMGMRYLAPPTAIPIPAKAVVNKPVKRPVVNTANSGGSGGSGALGWRDAPGSNMLGKSLPKVGEHEPGPSSTAAKQLNRRSKRLS